MDLEEKGMSSALVLKECKHEVLEEELLEVDLLLGKVNETHEKAQKPRDLLAGAETLLRITESLCSSLKSLQEPQRVLPKKFISRLQERYRECEGETINWTKLGLDLHHLFRHDHGIKTMIGSIDVIKIRRKPINRSKRPRDNVLSRPQLIEDVPIKENSDTQKKISLMFDTLRKQRRVRLEKLVLNRSSFSETVENIFALSFLIKDGRSEIRIDERGLHFVAPCNAPSAAAVASGEVINRQFIFRFDVTDWKLMKSCIAEDDEIMTFGNER